MCKNILGFLVKPTSNTETLQKLSPQVKWIIALVLIVLSYLAATFTNPLWIIITPNLVTIITSIFITIVMSMIIVAFIFLLAKALFKWKAIFLDTFFFFELSTFIYTIGTVITNLVAIKVLWIFGLYVIYIFLIWSLVLLSKSLAKINEITETKVTVVVVWAIIVFYFIGSTTWINIF